MSQPKQPKGHGLIIEPLAPTDYVSGDGNLSGAVINPEGDWTPYVIDHEKQAPKFETNACASFGTVDAAQALLKHFNSTVANLSDRFLAKVSNTDPNKGNSPQKVAQAFRDNWSCLEEQWSMEDAKDVADYYKPIPAHAFAQALARKGKHEFTYHAIKNPTAAKIREELKRGAVCMSVPAWAVDENGHYYRPKGWNDNHWVWVLYVDENGLYKVKDTYEPLFKTIVAEHIPEAAYRYNINEEAVDGILTTLANIIKSLIAYIKTKPEEPKPEPKPIPPANNLLNTMCLAIQKHEGWYPGSRSQRNNNPGNLVYVGQPGAKVEKEGRFAVFPTYEAGFNALKQMILNAASGKSKVYKPTMNLYQFFAVYAPAFENNDRHYAETVAKAMNVDPSTWKLAELV